MKRRRELRRLLEQPGQIVAPLVLDSLGARTAEDLGFSVVYLGGYALGSTTCVTEPLTTMTELVSSAARIAQQTSRPLIIDGDAGFGEPMHTMRTIEELIWMGVAGVHVEDQRFPKRAHYHRDYVEQTIPVDELVAKIQLAHEVRQRLDPDFVIIGRTDAIRTEGYDEGLRRAAAMLDAGADMVMLFPDDGRQAAGLPGQVDGPVAYVNSFGNRVGRPVLSCEESESYGYKLLVDAIGPLLAAHAAIADYYRRLFRDGDPGLDVDAAVALRAQVEDLVGMERYYSVEQRTLKDL